MRHVTVQQLSASLDGAITGPSLELVVRHLAVCHECRDLQARLAKHDDALRRLLAQDPDEAFLDDLTARAEALVVAILRGVPVPVMVTSVPLLHEEDPTEPAEPHSTRPDLGHPGEIATQAGWGRIGLKPKTPPKPPPSDPVEAQRLLDELSGGAAGDVPELTAQDVTIPPELEPPGFDLPAWIREQSELAGMADQRTPESPPPGPPSSFVDAHAGDTTRGATSEERRADDSPELEAVLEEIFHPDPAATRPRARAPLPPGDTALMQGAVQPQDGSSGPGGAGPRPPSPVSSAYARLQAGDPGRDTSPDQASPPRLGRDASPDYASPPRARRARRADHSLALAITSVASLLVLVFVLQLVPAAPVRPAGEGSVSFISLRVPRPMAARTDAADSKPASRATTVRTAATPAPREAAVMPSGPADSMTVAAPAIDSATQSATIAPPLESKTAPEADHSRESLAPTSQGTAATATSATAAAATRPTAKPEREPPAPAAVADGTDWPLLCGGVLDPAGQPVAGARVSVAGSSAAIHTDAHGHFCLLAPAGVHAVIVEAAGYKTQRVSATFATDGPELGIRLAPAP